MKINEYKVKQNGRTIDVTSFEPEDPICAVQVLHGMAEHKGRYTEMLTWLAMNDCMAVIHDHPGHGPDSSELGHFDDFNLLIENARAVSEILPETLPKFILGHSMGSIAARRLLENDGYDGGIIVGTGSKPSLNDAVSAGLLGAAAKASPRMKSEIINRLAFLGYDRSVRGTLKNRWLSEDESNVTQFNRDRYCGFSMSNRALSEILKNIRMSEKTRHFKKMDRNTPLLFIGGKDDPFSHKGRDIRRLAEKYSEHVDHVTVQLYDRSRHEVLFEKNREQVYDRLLEWVMRHV